MSDRFGAADTIMSGNRSSREERFNRLLQEHGPSISRLAYSYESVASIRAELVQEIALAIWQALPHFRGECSERTFVFRVAHNRGLTHSWKRRPAPQSLEDVAEGLMPTDPRPNPEHRAVESDQRARLAAAIQALPMPQRQIVVLMLEDLSNAEIAEVLGISENNVAVRLTRARQALRDALGVKL